jgi:short-chain 2-methylacyl-CoA dehydrogenase
MDESATMEPSVIKGLFEQGFMGIEIPEKFGGAGASFLSACLAIEELAKVDASVAVCADVQNTLVNNIIKMWASPAIQERVYPRLATDAVGSFCLSEPGSGSDAFALRTRAEKKGDSYLINGSKAWITNGGEADFFLIMATVDPSLGYKGITCFLAERGMPGLTVGKKEDKMGIRASSTVPLTFEDLRVPASNIVGELGKGYKIAIEILNEGRIGIAAQMLGIAEGAFETAVPYTFSRKQFGQAVGDFQGMQHQQAQCAMEIEATRLLVHNAARRKMAGLPFVAEAAMAKLYASQVAERVASRSVEWMGGMGFVKDMGAEKYYRDVKIGAIYEGTSNIMLTTIAKGIAAQYRK